MAVPLPIAILEAEARLHDDRLARYRSHRYGSRPTSGARFRQLTRASRLADERLRGARAATHDGAQQ